MTYAARMLEYSKNNQIVFAGGRKWKDSLLIIKVCYEEVMKTVGKHK